MADKSTILPGNASKAARIAAQKAVHYFLVSDGTIYNSSIGRRVKSVEANVYNLGTDKAEGHTIAEVTVSKDMCNAHGSLHGAFGMYLVDVLSGSAVTILGLAQKKGLAEMAAHTQSSSITWYRPSFLGDTLVVSSRTIESTPTGNIVECKITDKATGKLLIKGTQTFIRKNNSKL